jgi:hypothetical protein
MFLDCSLKVSNSYIYPRASVSFFSSEFLFLKGGVFTLQIQDKMFSFVQGDLILAYILIIE